MRFASKKSFCTEHKAVKSLLAKQIFEVGLVALFVRETHVVVRT